MTPLPPRPPLRGGGQPPNPPHATAMGPNQTHDPGAPFWPGSTIRPPKLGLGGFGWHVPEQSCSHRGDVGGKKQVGNPKIGVFLLFHPAPPFPSIALGIMAGISRGTPSVVVTPGPACPVAPRGVPQGHDEGDSSSSPLYKGISAQQSMAWVPTLQHPSVGQDMWHQALAVGHSGQGKDLLQGWRAAGERLRLLARKHGLKGKSSRRNEQESEKSLFCSITLCKPRLNPKCCPQRGWHRVSSGQTCLWMCRSWWGCARAEAPQSPSRRPSICLWPTSSMLGSCGCCPVCHWKMGDFVGSH